MGIIIFLIGAVMFGSIFYQRKYFRDYQTVTKVTGFFKGWGYLFIFMLCGFMPILFASQYGVIATVITSIIAIAATVAIFYLLITRRTKVLSAQYPNDKFVGGREIFACIGMSLYPFIAIFIVIGTVCLGVMGSKKRR